MKVAADPAGLSSVLTSSDLSLISLRKQLEEWLASKGKLYKRPPMTFPVKRRPPPKEKEALDRSFWDCMEEEMERQKVAQQIASTLAECMKLADEVSFGSSI